MQKQVGSNKILFALSREESTEEQRCSHSSRGPRSAVDHYSWKAGKNLRHTSIWYFEKVRFPVQDNYTPEQTWKQNSEDTQIHLEATAAEALESPGPSAGKGYLRWLQKWNISEEQQKEQCLHPNGKQTEKRQCCNYCNLDIRNWKN